MNYIIVEAETSELLAEEVEKKMNDGYFPQGGVAVIRAEVETRKGYTEVAFVFYQAMTRVDD